MRTSSKKTQLQASAIIKEVDNTEDLNSQEEENVTIPEAEEIGDKCEDVKCPVMFRRAPCADDSLLVRDDKASDECCPPDPYCKCDLLV